MSEEKYLGMKPGDLDDKPYAKYWNPQMASMQEQAQQALMHGIEASELGFPIAEANQLLNPGYLPLENGFTRLDNGQVFVSILTKMPKVTGKMIDWWMGWHSMETQRYKLWHPRAHQAVRTEKMIGDDPDISDHEKYRHNPCYLSEYVGGESLDLVLSFSDPAEFLDVSRFEKAHIGTAICGVVGYQHKPVNFAALIHLIRETDEGCEMRSRFWLGKVEIRGVPTSGILNKIASSQFVADHAVPIEQGKEMLVHCAMEMNHLASFLPELYAEYHPQT